LLIASLPNLFFYNLRDPLVPLAFPTRRSSDLGLAQVANIRSQTMGGGRRYGGAVNDNKYYRVNEDGRPEIFKGADGSQYMMPNQDRKSTRLNSSHVKISYAVFCLKKKKERYPQ